MDDVIDDDELKVDIFLGLVVDLIVALPPPTLPPINASIEEIPKAANMSRRLVVVLLIIN